MVTSVGEDMAGSTPPRSIGCDELLNVCSTPFTVTISVPVNDGPINPVHVAALIVFGSLVSSTSSPGCRWNVADPRSAIWPLAAGVALNGAPDSTAFARRA